MIQSSLSYECDRDHVENDGETCLCSPRDVNDNVLAISDVSALLVVQRDIAGTDSCAY